MQRLELGQEMIATTDNASLDITKGNIYQIEDMSDINHTDDGDTIQISFINDSGSISTTKFYLYPTGQWKAVWLQLI